MQKAGWKTHNLKEKLPLSNGRGFSNKSGHKPLLYLHSARPVFSSREKICQNGGVDSSGFTTFTGLSINIVFIVNKHGINIL